MKYFAIAPSLLCAASLALSSSAQIPVDHAARFAGGGVGVEDIDVSTGTVTELPGGPGFANSVNCAVIDPVTGNLWGGGLNFSDGRVWKGTLSGLSIAAWDVFSDLPGGNAGTGIDLDWNGDIFICENDTLYKVDRVTGSFSTWDTNTYGMGNFNALTIAQDTNTMYVGTWDDGTLGTAGVIEYDLSTGPGSGTVVADFPAMGFDGRINGMDDIFGVLYVATSEDTLGQSLIILDPVSGFAFTATGAPTGNAVNGVRVDRKTGLVHMADLGTSMDNYWTLEVGSGTLKLIATTAVAGQLISDLDINDFTDRTEVFPQRPSASAAFTLETAAHGEAGKFAGTAIVAFNGVPLAVPIVLGFVVCDSGGFATINVPVAAGTLSSGDMVTLSSARFVSGSLVLGTSVDVVFGP